VENEIPELAIAVVPDYRGQGIGSHLLTQVLSTATINYPAVSLSERIGFMKIPESEGVNCVGEVSFNFAHPAMRL